MKPYEFDVVEISAARLMPEFRFAPGWREAIAAFYRTLMRIWVGLYAPPPRHPGPMV